MFSDTQKSSPDFSEYVARGKFAMRLEIFRAPDLSCYRSKGTMGR